MRAALAKVVASVDLRDIHCYGGMLMAGGGCSMLFGRGAGLLVVGLALFYLALRKAV